MGTTCSSRLWRCTRPKPETSEGDAFFRSRPLPPAALGPARHGRRVDPAVPEASLERLDPDALRDTMDALGPDDAMRIFGRGLRRRLAAMLGGDGPRLRLAFSLLFAMPGAPLICYGDEIGMGKDLSQKGRNGGFSTAQGAIGPGPGDVRFRSRRRQRRRPMGG